MLRHHNLLRFVPEMTIKPNVVFVFRLDPFELMIKTFRVLGFVECSRKNYTQRVEGLGLSGRFSSIYFAR